ncbi:MAG: hemerythrin domain-containing protein [Desulfobacterales bacterium]|jgi:iron-sulfur cluster repair protein YtfE (RIC family)|nr:hemerythrin domain-containing protein [Desulfobacterales bacterium]
MADMDNINNMIAKLSREHKIITDYVIVFFENVKKKDREFIKGLNDFVNFLKKDLLRHFEIEELVFFPAAILGAAAFESTLMVMNLQKDHGALEKQLQTIIELSKNADLSPEVLNQNMIASLDIFFKQLKVHVKREMIDLYPMIDENPRSRSLLKTYAAELKKGSSNAIQPDL